MMEKKGKAMGKVMIKTLIVKRVFLRLTAVFVLAASCSILFAALPQGSQDKKSLPVNDYRIGAKDLLEIKIFELPELNQTVRVSEDGTVTFGILGKVEVGGLTAQELEKKLASILDQKYTKGAHVSVFIREYQKVAVLGAVGRPGMYELVGPTSLLQMISQAGGLTAQAMKEVYVYRSDDGGEKRQITINIEDLLKGKPGLNLMLEPKDEIVVPMDQQVNVFVYGEVRTPGAVPFMKSQRITVLQAIAQAGGTTEWAKKSRVLIKRRDPKTGKEMKISVNLNRIISGRTSDIFLEEGDVVIVP
jgi:polysaccharide export outer membrane protein